MNFNLHIALKIENAACAFVQLALTSFSIPPVVVRLPRYWRHYHQELDEIPSLAPRGREVGWAGSPGGLRYPFWRALSYYHHARSLFGGHRKRTGSSSRFSQGSRSTTRSSRIRCVFRVYKNLCSIPRSALTLILSVAIWSQQDLSLQHPACSSGSLSNRTLLATERRA